MLLSQKNINTVDFSQVTTRIHGIGSDYQTDRESIVPGLSTWLPLLAQALSEAKKKKTELENLISVLFIKAK